MARTARQRAALKKAQAASARKRRGKGRGKLAKAHRRSRRNARIAVGAGVVAGVAIGLGGYAAGKKSRTGSANKRDKKLIKNADRAVRRLQKSNAKKRKAGVQPVRSAGVPNRTLAAKNRRTAYTSLSMQKRSRPKAHY